MAITKSFLREMLIQGITYEKELSPAQLENAQDHSYINC